LEEKDAAVEAAGMGRRQAGQSGGGRRRQAEGCDVQGHVVMCTFLKWSQSSNGW